MPVCPQKVPELQPTSGDPQHLQACFLDEDTKAREVARLQATVKAGTGVSD
jgi:hypothetical protein